MYTPCRILPLLVACLGTIVSASAQLVINEIHYHPVEQEAFNADGTPALDLTEDVHEFVELYNSTGAPIDLSNWTLTDAVTYTFPAGTTIAAGGYTVIARNPARIQTVYGISGVLGPYVGALSNNAATIKLRDASGNTVDSVGYSAAFPWPTTADALGAGEDWTNVDPLTYQYKGRSLQRVSVTASSNDPANWLASPLSPGPTPGAANAVTLATPKPVIVAKAVTQVSDEASIIRANQQARVEVTFSDASTVSNVQLEYFIDDIESTSETRNSIAMTVSANGAYSAVIPGQLDRKIVRYRIKANRGSGDEVVAPRADDAAIVPVAGGAREGWFGYFVTPVRSLSVGTGWASERAYDIFVSSTSLTQLNTNITQNPRRVIASDPPGYPRDEAYDSGITPQGAWWNGTQPGIFCCNGDVYDIVIRYHGSRYRRSASRQSYKIQFPRTELFEGLQGFFETDKADQDNNGTQEDYKTVVAHMLHREAGIPTSYTRWVDMYLNSNSLLVRLEQSECDNHLLDKFYSEQKLLNPSQLKQQPGEVYKAKGLQGDEGPYGFMNGQPLVSRSAGALVPGGVWTPLLRYQWSSPLQDNQWKGYKPLKDMIDGMWTARGDLGTALSNPSVAANPNVANLRTYFAANWDVDKALTYLALRQWECPWDDIFHNYYVLRQDTGKWMFMPWDFDSEFDGQSSSYSIFFGRSGDSQTNANGRGPQWFKDSFMRAYDAEFRQKMWILNNTLLDPNNLQQLGAFTLVNWKPWAQQRQSSVNTQLGLGTFYRPAQPVNQSPANNASALPPATLQASAYSNPNPTPRAHTATLWEIRHESSTYRTPVYRNKSTTDLTSLAIPFAELTVGQRYYWRCTYYDADDHPSLASAETAFYFGTAPSTTTLLTIDATTNWKYNIVDNYSNTNSGPSDPTWWASKTFDDTTANWLSGPGVLGYDTKVLPQPIRTWFSSDGTSNGSPLINRFAFYFRKTFNFPGSPVGAVVQLRHIIDDGCVIYINGVELPASFRFNMPSGTITSTTPATVSATAAYSAWLNVPASYFVQGQNTIAVEVHQITTGSSDMDFGLEMQATIPFAAGDITINEVLADNQHSVSNAGRHQDYVELYNNTFSDIDIGGWGFTDDILNPTRYVFPAATVVPAQGYLTVWCDGDVTAPGLHCGFGLSAAGQLVALTQGNNIKDYVEFGPQATDLALGRFPNGSGAWTAVTPSLGAANTAVTLGSVSTLKVNEWMAEPASGDDWFEIYNPDANPVALEGLYLSDTPGTPTITKIPPLSFIGGKGFSVFLADGSTAGKNHCNFKLSGSGDNLVLTNTNGSTAINSVTFGAQVTNVSQGRLPDGAASPYIPFPQSPSPGASNYLPGPIVINEALTNSSAPFEDAIELYNPTGSAISIGGWWLSDDPTNLQKYQIPAGTTIAANGYRVFYENQFNPTPGVGNSFSLSSLGDEIYLSAVNGGGALTGYRAQVKFGAAADNTSYGRVPVTGGGAEFWPQVARTFGADSATTVEEFRTGGGKVNGKPKIGPIIVNEVMYHPPDGVGPVDNPRDEYIELMNVTALPVDISGWRLKGASDFTFPAGSVLQSGQYALMVSFDPADTATLNAFLTQYGLSPGTTIFGPYTPKLSNSTQSIEIAYAGPMVGDEIPLINVEKVEYADAMPWPAAADGTGSSLQRVDRKVIGNDPGNWVAAAPTPGAINPGEAPFDPITQTPILSAPVSGAFANTTVNVSFTLPEAALAGSVKLIFDDGVNKRTMTLAASQETAGDHGFSFNPSNPNAAAEIVSITGGASIPDGNYTVSISYQDTSDNDPASASSTNVRIDNVAPQLSLPANFTVEATGPGGAVVNYDVTATDSGSGVANIMVTPASGSTLPVGNTTVNATATDNAGNTSMGSFVVTVRPAAAVTTVRFAQGSPAPGAGTPDGPPADALLASFNDPAIDDSGALAFLARWTSTSGRGTGIFSDTACIAQVGGAAQTLAGVTFKTLSSPVINGGRVAFLATLAGVPAAQSSAVISDAPTGALEIVARAGDDAPGVGGAKFKKFQAAATAGGHVAFLAQLQAGTGLPKVTAGNDLGLWVKDSTHALTRLLSEGQTVGARTIKTLTAFKAGSGSPGQGRGWVLAPNDAAQVLALVTFTDRTQAVVKADIGGSVTVMSDSAGTAGVPNVNGASFQSYGLPIANSTGRTSFLGTLAAGPGGVTKANSRGVFADDGAGSYSSVARVGDSAGNAGETFSVLRDPVLSEDGGLAFPANLKGGAARGLGQASLWWKPANGNLAMLAQGGAEPPEIAGGQWKSFTSLGIIATRGPIFSATLVPGKGGVTKATAAGVWAIDFSNAPRVLFRSGDSINGKTLKSYSILKALPGSVGVTRSFNDSAHVVWRATFTDKTTAIVSTEIP